MSVNRTALPANNGTWPDLIRLDLAGTNSVAAGDLLHTTFYYQYAGSSNLTVQLFLDGDFNPYNANGLVVTQFVAAATGAGSVVAYSNFGFSTTNIPPGTYAIGGKISDGAHSRYLYAAQKVQIGASRLPPVLDIGRISSGSYRLGVNGLTGQKVVVQISTNLQAWLPLVTNTMSTNRWVYTNNPAVTRQFYRAVLP